jgi:PAS domain S-box-containing protein
LFNFLYICGILWHSNERRLAIKKLLRELHHGRDESDIKKQFKKAINTISSEELMQIEQELIDEGLPEEEIKRLCDVHVEVMKEQLQQKSSRIGTEEHPLSILKAENEAIQKLLLKIDEILEKYEKLTSKELFLMWKQKNNLLFDIEKHYLKKENLLFPILEKKGFYGPATVMWGIHDDIREEMKNLATCLNSNSPELVQSTCLQQARTVYQKIADMIYKEEKVLFPTSEEKLTDEDWYKIAIDIEEIGYCLIDGSSTWKPEKPIEEVTIEQASGIRLSTGGFTLEQLETIFSYLPVDITFVDEEDRVKFFSNSKDRIFVRSKAIIGRKVQNCHPPKSVHVVEKILSDFKENKRDIAEFWLKLQEKFIHIRYFALRDQNKTYLGTLEVSQDVTDIRKLEGEKRLDS